MARSDFRSREHGGSAVTNVPWGRGVARSAWLCFSQEVQVAPCVSACVPLYGLSPSVVIGLC